MRVLVAMSGGVDSSVAAALLAERLGTDAVVGATLKLWGGPSDSGCCSVADVEDARRVADRLGITHHVFNFSEAFEASVVGPYVSAHAAGLTPNPCIECNRQVKFDLLLDRAMRLGFDAVATGHYARLREAGGRRQLLRGRDPAKDQSYVLSMLGQEQLARCLFPIGDLAKSEVRAEARRLGLRTAGKPDSQDVCFIRSDAGRAGFLRERIALHPGEVVDAATGSALGGVDAVELVTVGQRRGLGHTADGRRRYALRVDVTSRRVEVGTSEQVMDGGLQLSSLTFTDRPLTPGETVVAQASAHGRPVASVFLGDGLRFTEPQRRVAPGQTVAFYDRLDPEVVRGSGVVGG